MQYHEWKDQQTALIAQHLRLMVQRRAGYNGPDAFTCLSDDPTDSVTEPSLNAYVELPAAVSAAQGWANLDGVAGIDSIYVPSSQENGGQNYGSGGDANPHRYIQYCFMPRTFYIDLPNNTLFADEAERLLRRRTGFCRLAERRPGWMPHREWCSAVRDWNPVQKEYLNEDVRTAAEDAFYILYSLWSIPADGSLYYRCARFNCSDRLPWEGDGRISD